MGSKPTLAMNMLMWLSHSERPLTTDELCDALGVEIGSVNRNSEDIPTIETLLGCSLGLVVVEASTYTVRLVHRTFQEYLRNNTDLFHSPHATIAEVCLTYLNFQFVRDLSRIPYQPPQKTLLLEYASCYWGIHARKELSDCGVSLALNLLQRYDSHISAGLLLERAGHLDRDDPCPSFQFSGLHCASFFGIVDVVAALAQAECYDINGRDFLGYTPLVWAAQYGHEGVVKILLGRQGVDPGKPDKFAQTPLSYAAWGGHEGVVKTLLEQEGVHPDKPNNYSKAPLSYAAWNGSEEVVKMLLGRDEVNPDRPDRYGVTPLSYAAWRGHAGVVKIFLGREGVNPDKPDNRGQTPLSYAAQYGHEGVVEILLGREEVNPNKPDNGGRTPLSYAAQYGREGVAGILLNQEGVAPDKPDNGGQTPLMFAAKHGHDKVVALLQPYEQQPRAPYEASEILPSESRYYFPRFGGCRTS